MQVREWTDCKCASGPAVDAGGVGAAPTTPGRRRLASSAADDVLRGARLYLPNDWHVLNEEKRNDD